MEDNRVDAEALCAIELVDHRGDRLAVELRICRGEVDQIRRVRQHRADGALLGERRAVGVGQFLPLPLIRILREQRHGRRIDGGGPLENRRQAALRRKVRADEIAGSVGKGEAVHQSDAKRITAV
jgi:hypothetical protein